MKKRKIRVFRWLWRFSYLYVIGGLVYIVYDGYVARHPEDQFTPDPNKKTLVVLGMFLMFPLDKPSALGLVRW